ncbi:MAG: Jag N-terminal domain-containing protein [Candidatus Omnitrophica bacterium]|nr:Jag N-terminal domain-containing protein [Candidatus Omnitrophota bacterium]
MISNDFSSEFEAPTVKEAIKIALKKLNLKKAEVDVKVLREEHKGLFGMEGAEPAKIKVTPKKKLDKNIG